MKPSGICLTAGLFMAAVVASQAAPADQNYDGSPVGSLGGTSVTLNGIEYSNNDSGGFPVSIVNNGDLASGGDHALAYRSTGLNTSTMVSFKTSDGSEFKLNSFAISVGFGNTKPTISGYRDGGQVVTTTYDLTDVWFGTFNVSGNASWENIDEVRITSSDLDIDIDDLDFSPAVVPNDPPTDIALSGNTVNQSAGANAVVGSLSSTDENSGDTHTYTLEAGSGDTDNGSFNISGTDLRANNAGALAAGTYSVRIQTDDSQGGTHQESFTVTVVDDVAPQIVSIARKTPAQQTVDTGSVVFAVTFSEDVTGVTAASFALTAVNGSTVEGAVSEINGGPSVYDVTVQITSGTGEFRLDAAAQ